MIRSKAVSRIQQILGFRTDMEVESIEALMEAQEDAEAGEMGFLPYFLRATASYNLAPQEILLRLPDDFIREYDHEKYALWFSGGVGPAVRLPYVAPDRAGELMSERQSYWIDGQDIRLTYRIQESLNAEYLYYKFDEKLTEDSSENGWLKYGSKYMIGSAGRKLAGIMNKNSLEMFDRMMLEGKDLILRQDTAFRMGTRKPQFGQGLDRDYRDSDYLGVENDRDLGD